MLSCAETHGNVAETWISYNSVDVIRPKRSRKYKVTFRKHVFLLFPLTWSDRMSTEILGFFSETDFSLVSADVFRPRGDWNTRFCSRNTFFSCFLYIRLFQHSLFSWSSFFITGRVNMLWSCSFIQPLPDFNRPFAKSMLHTVKSHKYKSCFFFTASINLFYYFLQSIDRWQLIFFFSI